MEFDYKFMPSPLGRVNVLMHTPPFQTKGIENLQRKKEAQEEVIFFHHIYFGLGRVLVLHLV